jgi:SAM-dependent methyltransferase
MTTRWQGPFGNDYDARFARLEAAGMDMHGEADLVFRYAPRTVLDAGCGTGRVAIELARRGVEVVGVDLDAGMLDAAREKAPDLVWVLADLTDFDLGRRFDVVVAAGNVMIFLAPGSEPDVVARLAAHVAPGGRLIAGFQLTPGRLDLGTFDRLARDQGLTLEDRWATWDEQPLTAGGDYAVSVFRRGP